MTNNTEWNNLRAAGAQLEELCQSQQLRQSSPELQQLLGELRVSTLGWIDAGEALYQGASWRARLNGTPLKLDLFDVAGELDDPIRGRQMDPTQHDPALWALHWGLCAAKAKRGEENLWNAALRATERLNETGTSGAGVRSLKSFLLRISRSFGAEQLRDDPCAEQAQALISLILRAVAEQLRWKNGPGYPRSGERLECSLAYAGLMRQSLLECAEFWSTAAMPRDSWELLLGPGLNAWRIRAQPDRSEAEPTVLAS